MNDVFEKIKIRRVILFYIIAFVLTSVIVQVPMVKNIYSTDTKIPEIIIQILLLSCFYFSFRKNKVLTKNILLESIRNINYKKITKMYILSIGMYIAIIIMYLFKPDKSLLKETSILSLFITSVVLAPLLEELMFRGVMLNRLKIKFGLIPAIYISAFVFAIIHFDNNLLTRFFTGVLCAIIFIETKNFLNCIILHMLNNASVLIVLIIVKLIPFSIHTSANVNEVMQGIAIFFIIAYMILNIVYIKKHSPKKTAYYKNF